jgi:hypothetical protein
MLSADEMLMGFTENSQVFQIKALFEPQGYLTVVAMRITLSVGTILVYNLEKRL